MEPLLFRRIAVATDGSEEAEAAVGVAIDLAKRYAADLLVIAIAPLPPVYTTPSEPLLPQTVPSDPVPYYRKLVDAAVARARAAGVSDVSGVCDEGVVVDGILAQVKNHGSDLVVVGSRGLSSVRRLLLGSVSTALVNHAPATVLVVRTPTPSA
jgi:nucleotide-binding universal stress UspA family protein